MGEGPHSANTGACCAILQIAAQNGFEISLDDIYQRSRRPIR
jgi:hypothetical protein